MIRDATNAGRIRMLFQMQRGAFAMNIDTEVSIRGVTGIFGASGAGKTTLLRCIAGLERADNVKLKVDDEVWEDSSSKIRLSAGHRNTGFVFQDARLFPHMSVRRNLEYGHRRSANNGNADFDSIVSLLGLESMLERSPDSLSGGEAQRVAIGRALLRSPRFLLMDEPVSALDKARRNEVLPFIEKLHASTGIPIVYVSHNIDEICLLCDQLLVLDAGRVLADGNLQDVLMKTALPLLGGEEASAVLSATALAYDSEFALTRVAVDGGELWVPGEQAESNAGLRLRIRANDVSLIRERPVDSSILNMLDVSVDSIQDESPHSVLVHLRCGGNRLLSRITRKSCADLGINVNQTMVAQIKSVSVRSALAPQESE